MLGLIIDDGVTSRGHRDNIFSTEYEWIGIYSVVQGDKIKTVMNFHSEDLVLEEESDNEGGNDHHNTPHHQPHRPQPKQ